MCVQKVFNALNDQSYYAISARLFAESREEKQTCLSNQAKFNFLPFLGEKNVWKFHY